MKENIKKRISGRVCVPLTERNLLEGKLNDILSLLEKNNNGKEEEYRRKYEELEKDFSAEHIRVIDSLEREEEERTLKNIAYSFLISKGLLSEFLDFCKGNRTKEQEFVYKLVKEKDLKRNWIEEGDKYVPTIY